MRKLMFTITLHCTTATKEDVHGTFPGLMRSFGRTKPRNCLCVQNQINLLLTTSTQ